jgi:hypothetical protein
MPRKNTLEEILSEPVDLPGLIDHLDFSEENIIQANREQPQLYLEASRYRVKRMRARIRAESNLDTEKAQASIFLRLKSRNSKDKNAKLTEPYIKEKVAVSAAVVEARESFDKAQVYEEWSQRLLEAYRQRGHAIQTLAQLLGAEASAQARLVRKEVELAGLESLKDSVRKRYPGRGE